MTDPVRVYARTPGPGLDRVLRMQGLDGPHVELHTAEALDEASWRRGDDRPLDATGYFGLARALADEAADRMAAHYPGLFDLLPGVDLRPAFVLVTTLRLGVKELPGLLSFYVATAALPPKPTAVVGVELADWQHPRIRSFLGEERAPAHVEHRTNITPTFLDRALTRYGAGHDAGVDEVIGALDAGERPALLLCGNPADLRYLVPLRDVLDRRVVVLAKNERPEAVQASRDLAADGGAVVSGAVLSVHTGRPEVRGRVLEGLHAVHHRHGELGEDELDFRLSHLARLLPLLHAACALDAILDAARPAVAAGAIDRNQHGPLLSALGPLHGTATVNLQHGTFLPARISDTLAPDLSLVWNDRSRRQYLDDGYPPERPLVVTGNPTWQRLAADAAAPPSDTAVGLSRWAEGYRLVAAFPQDVKGPFLLSEDLDRFFTWLADGIAAHPELRLLVKLRPRASGRIESAARALDDGVAAGRVRVATDEEAPLADVLRAADAAVGIYSTALADAVAAGVPAIAVDPGYVTDALDVDFADAVERVRSAAELDAVLADVAAGRLEVRPDEGLLPRLDGQHQERLRRALEEHLPADRPADAERTRRDREARASGPGAGVASKARTALGRLGGLLGRS